MEPDSLTLEGTAVVKGTEMSAEDEGDDDMWEQVGPKNKSVITRSVRTDKSLSTVKLEMFVNINASEYVILRYFAPLKFVISGLDKNNISIIP